MVRFPGIFLVAAPLGDCTVVNYVDACQLASKRMLRCNMGWEGDVFGRLTREYRNCISTLQYMLDKNRDLLVLLPNDHPVALRILCFIRC